MKLILLLLTVAFLQVSATGVAQQVTLKKKSVSLKKVFEDIYKQTGYQFVYSYDLLRNANKISIDAKKEPLKKVLEACFKDQPFTYLMIGKAVIVKKRKKVDALQVKAIPPIEVTGKVTDSLGNPLIGVTIKAKEGGTGTVTDANGNYTILVPDDAVLMVSYVGYQTKEVPVNGKEEINIVLKASISELNQLVVVGYGKQKKVSVTGSISSVDSKELRESPTANVSNMMVGRLPGLLATQTSGEPGADQATLRIRGVSTFSGSQSPLILVDGVEASNFNDIDPNEIESVNILKDASATAVYGVRGANGVILITTKRGNIGKPKISFTSNIALKSFTTLRYNMGSYDWARLYNEALRYDSYITGTYQPKYSEQELELYKSGDDPIFYPNTNWAKLMFKPYSLQTHQNLNIRGGTEKVKYFISGSYFVQGGLFNDKMELPKDLAFDPQVKFKRYNFRSNLDFNILKNLKLTLDVSAKIGDKNVPSASVPYIIVTAFAAPPISSPGIIDGKVINLPGAVNLVDEFTNPMVVWLSGFGNENGYNRENNSYLDGLIRLNYGLDFITEGLSAEGTLSYKNFTNATRHLRKPTILYHPVRLSNDSILFVPSSGAEQPLSYYNSTQKRRRIYSEFKLNYKRSFGPHEITGLILYDQGKLYDPTLEFSIPHAYQGLVGRITYNYKEKYFAEFDAGYNGTENFAIGKRFGFFPAYSLGYVISNEAFFPKNNYVTFLKLRGSYGVVGNDKIGGDRFLYLPSAYYYDNIYHFGVVGSNYNSFNISNEGKIGNPNLTWEKAKKINIGIDVHLLSSRFELTANWFQEKRNNILTNLQSTPNIVGANLPAFNIGRMENKGIDGNISFNDNIGKFSYWIKGNYTYTHNTILFQDEIPHPYPYQDRTGLSLGQYFGFVSEGFYNTWDEVIDAKRPKSNYNTNRLMPGDFKYKDVNGDGIIDEDDQVPIGYTNFPAMFYGFSFGADYKNFYLSILFQGAAEYSHNPSKKYFRGWQEDGPAPVYFKYMSWTPERYEKGLPIKLPHISSSKSQNNNYQQNTLRLENSSYLRLKNIEIGYRLPRALLKGIGINSARVYLNGNNLHTWDKLFPGEDPAIPSYNSGDYEPYPITKTFNLGINITL